MFVAPWPLDLGEAFSSEGACALSMGLHWHPAIIRAVGGVTLVTQYQEPGGNVEKAGGR